MKVLKLFVWGGTHNDHIKPLEKAQKSIIKIMNGKTKKNPSKQLFQVCDILDI